MLRSEGLQFQVCKNTELKCTVLELVHLTIRIYFTYKNTYRYIDVLRKFVRAYINTVHLTTDIGPSRVTDTDVLAIWKRMEAQRRRVCVAKLTFHVG